MRNAEHHALVLEAAQKQWVGADIIVTPHQWGNGHGDVREWEVFVGGRLQALATVEADQSVVFHSKERP